MPDRPARAFYREAPGAASALGAPRGLVDSGLGRGREEGLRPLPPHGGVGQAGRIDWAALEPRGFYPRRGKLLLRIALLVLTVPPALVLGRGAWRATAQGAGSR